MSASEEADYVNFHSGFVETCMAAKGFVWEARRLNGADISADRALSKLDLWRLDDERHAANHGYGIAKAAEMRRSHIEVQKPEGDASGDAYHTALVGNADKTYVLPADTDHGESGSSGAGCIGDASRALLGEPGKVYELRRVRGFVESEAWRRAMRSTDLNEALIAWSGCMLQNGWDVRTPNDAFKLASQGQEAQVAQSDARCKNQTGLGGVFDRVFTNEAMSLLRANDEALVELRRLEREAVARAAP